MQRGVNVMKYTDKILPRKWVETECGFLWIVLLYIQVTIWLLSITLGISRVTFDKTCLNVKSSKVLEKRHL